MNILSCWQSLINKTHHYRKKIPGHFPSLRGKWPGGNCPGGGGGWCPGGEVAYNLEIHSTTISSNAGKQSKCNINLLLKRISALRNGIGLWFFSLTDPETSANMQIDRFECLQAGSTERRRQQTQSGEYTQFLQNRICRWEYELSKSMGCFDVKVKVKVIL